MKKSKENIHFAHINNYEQKDEICINMTYILLKNLPKYIHGSKTKSGFKKAWSYTKPTISALRYDKFIVFNSETRISTMIFDIDSKEYNFDEQYNLILDIIHNTPCWFIETDRGYQFGYVFEKSILISDHSQKIEIRLRSIKESIIIALNCDKNGSMKNIGFMRNPLASKNVIFNPYETIELNDFNTISPIKYHKNTTKKSASNIVYNTSKGFEVGKRNDFLFIRGLEIAKNKVINSVDSLTEDICNYQDKMKTDVNKLDVMKIRKLAKGVFQYWQSGKIYQYIGKSETKYTPRDKISIFEEYGRYLNDEEYARAVRKRQSESAIKTNMDFRKQIDKKRNKVANDKANKVYKYLKKNKLKTTQVNMLKYSKILYVRGLSRAVAKRFLDKRK